MSARIPRLEEAFPVTRDAEGRKLCRWDQKPIKPPRQTFCSKECVHQVSLRTNPNYLRSQVRQRDKGVCARCSFDTAKLKRVFEHAARAYYEVVHGIGTTQTCWFPGEFWMAKSAILKRLNFNKGTSLWEADHIVEVINGGDSNLENMQTLCVPCHKAKTKQLAASRATARRRIRQPSLLEVESGA